MPQCLIYCHNNLGRVFNTSFVSDLVWPIHDIMNNIDINSIHGKPEQLFVYQKSLIQTFHTSFLTTK